MGSTGMPRLAFGPDPLFNDAAESELYQAYKPKSLPASGWGGTPEAAMAIGQNFLEGLSRGRAQSRAESERDKTNKLNALRIKRDSIATDKGIADEAERGRLLADLDCKIAEVALASTEKPGPTSEPHGALGHVGRFFSNAVTRIAGHSGQAPSLGTVAEGDREVPWMEHFNQEAAGLKRVPTAEQASKDLADVYTQAQALMKAEGGTNIGDYVLRIPGFARAYQYAPQGVQQIYASRLGFSPSENLGSRRADKVADALVTPENERTPEQAGYVHLGEVMGNKPEYEGAVVGSFNKDGSANFFQGRRNLRGELIDREGNPLAPGFINAGGPGAPFGTRPMESDKGIIAHNVMTGKATPTGFGVYFDPALAAYHRAMVGNVGWQMHQLQNQEKANAFLEDVRAYTGGNPLLMDKEIKRRVDLRLIDPMVAGYARTLWGTQDFTRARTGATEAGGALNDEKAKQTKEVTKFFTPPGRESAPQAQQDHRPASVSGGAAEYNNLIGGHAQQYSAPNTPVSSRTGVPIAAPQSAPPDAVAAYQKLLSGFRARGTNPSDIYNSHFSQASAGSAPASFYNSLY